MLWYLSLAQAQLLSRRLGARSTLPVPRTRTIRDPTWTSTWGYVIIEYITSGGEGQGDDYRRFFAARGRRFEPRGLYSSSLTQSDGGSSLSYVSRRRRRFGFSGGGARAWYTYVPGAGAASASDSSLVVTSNFSFPSESYMSAADHFFFAGDGFCGAGCGWGGGGCHCGGGRGGGAPAL